MGGVWRVGDVLESAAQDGVQNNLRRGREESQERKNAEKEVLRVTAAREPEVHGGRIIKNSDI